MADSTWLLDANGQRYDLAGLGALTCTPSLAAMAHACAQIARFTGHARRPYSVAEHQLLCADIAQQLDCSPTVQLCCLTHDLHEAYTGDVASPVKWALGAAWDKFEHPHARRVRQHLGLSSAFAAHRVVIKAIDLIALATERRDLMAWDTATCDPWPILDTPGAAITPWPDVDLSTRKRAQTNWQEWRDQWLARYHALHGSDHSPETAA